MAAFRQQTHQAAKGGGRMERGVHGAQNTGTHLTLDEPDAFEMLEVKVGVRAPIWLVTLPERALPPLVLDVKRSS